tara:strand:- start:238 stop:441 length:204 start_codon:yes stop_codon:yes gene_type:complete
MTLDFTNDVITNEELEAAGEFYDGLDLGLEELETEIEAFGSSQVSFDEIEDFENSFDEMRDLDFYDS